MKKVKELSAIYLIGAIGYSVIEIIWRGFTHWTMTLTGGLCFVCYYITDLKFKSKRLWERCLMGSAMITTIEFTVGCIVNLALKWRVWDYSGMQFNILGQICPLYSGLWFLLCMPLSGLCGRLRKRFAQHEQPLSIH